MFANKKINRRRFCFSTGIGGMSAFMVSACGTTGKKNKEFTLDEDPPAFTSGLQYQYQHQGPYPWSDSNIDISGRRVVTITGKTTGSPILWRVEDFFESIEGTLVSMVDDQYLLHYQEVETDQTTLMVQNTPAQPLRYLKIKEGEEKKFTIKQSIKRNDTNVILGESRISLTTKRQQDVRIITQAGAFMCRQFLTRIEIAGFVLGRQSLRTATEESYWCDQISWFVEQKHLFDPVTEDGSVIHEGYETKSSLVAFNQPYGQFEGEIPASLQRK